MLPFGGEWFGLMVLVVKSGVLSGSGVKKSSEVLGMMDSHALLSVKVWIDVQGSGSSVSV